MIKTRLVKLLAHARKYIIYQIMWQWISLAAQITAIFQIAGLLGSCMELLLSGEQREPLPDLMPTFLVLAVCVAVRFLCDRMNVRASFAASADVKRILRSRIYGKLLRLGAGYRESTGTSEVVQMATEGVEQLEVYFGKYLSQLFYSLLAPVTLFLVLVSVDLKASVVLLVCVPLIPISIVVVQKIAKRLLSRYWGAYTQLGDGFLENLQGLTTLKIYEADGQKAVEMDREAEHFRRITMKVLTMQLNSTSVMDIVAYGGAAVGMLVAVQEAVSGHVDFAGALTILLLAAEFFLPLRLLGSYFHIAMNGMAASDKIFALLDVPEPEEKSEIIREKEISVSLDQVHFSYEKGREILKGVSLSLPAVSFTALVGVSGCGKSTIAGILTGQNSGYEGSIRLNGHELRELSEKSLMEHVTIIRHNSYIFKGTIRDNLAIGFPVEQYGGSDPVRAAEQDKQMLEALRKVNLLDFVQSKQGLDTPVAERGSNLSGGQCQRLALARGLLHNTPMYILDEATSNIDIESEEMIMKVIHELAKEKTVLLISHRLANVVRADNICMLESGKIVESGTHEQLMERRGVYYRLYESQRILEDYGKETRA